MADSSESFQCLKKQTKQVKIQQFQSYLKVFHKKNGSKYAKITDLTFFSFPSPPSAYPFQEFQVP